MNIIVTAAIIALGINLLMFIPAYLKKTDKLTDISYAVSFGVTAIVCFALSSREPLHFMILLAVLLWALRLGSFLFARVNRTKRDKRFDGMRDNFRRFLGFWALQGVTVFLVLLAAILFWSRPGVETTWLAYLGIAIFALGLLIEKTADTQKSLFAARAKNRYAWIDHGLWRLSRHPNYLGEILIWTGIYVAVFQALDTTLYRTIGAVSPLFITTLLLFVSGVPLLEKTAEKKWGKLHTYKAYKKNTPVLLPNATSLKRFLKNPS